MAPERSDAGKPKDPTSIANNFERREAILEAFRSACARPQPPTVAQLRNYLQALPREQHGDMLVDLVAEHLQRSWEGGWGQRLENYLVEFGGDFPEFASAAVTPAELIEREFLARHAFPGGDCPSLGEYRQRFPDRRDVVDLLQARNLDGGRYVKVRLQGMGGMGQVWQGYDRHLQRHVAIKEVKLPLAGDGAILKRLAHEARVTAGLEHYAIVTVHELKEVTEERPFYVMRLVQGRTLREVIGDYHRGAVTKQDSQRRMLWNSLLQAFATVCDAIAYAHERGVLHRDLKPEQVKLGAFGETVVLDWGLAKRVAGGASTTPAAPWGGEVREATGGAAETPNQCEGMPTPQSIVRGTPAYMAPEQLHGASRQTEVFNLGATLYEILTGRAPYELADGKEADTYAVHSRIQSAEYERPRRVRRGVPRALEAICLKAMAPELSKRYASVADLGKDVRRYLADEPVSAYAEPLTARLARWVRRHKPLVSGALALLLTAVAALAVGLWTVEGERRKTALERDAKVEALRAETSARDQAMAALRSLTDDVIAQQLGRNVQLTAQDKAFLRKILTHYESFASIRGEGPESRAIRGEGLARVGLIRHKLGELREAEKAYREAVEARKSLAAEFPTAPEYRQRLAETYNHLGMLLAATHRFQDAESVYRDALGLDKALVAEFPNVPQYRVQLITTYNTLGVLLAETGRREEAERALRAALALDKASGPDFHTSPEYRLALAFSHNNLGALLTETGRHEEAEALIGDAVAIYKALVDDFPDVLLYRDHLGGSYNRLGLLLKNTLRWEKAEAAFREALNIYQELVIDFPAVPEYRHHLGGIYHNLAILFMDAGRREKAEDAIREALTIHKAAAFAFPKLPRYREYLAGSYNRLGLLLATTGRHGEAEEAYRDGLKIYTVLAADYPKLPQYRQGLAGTYNNLAVLLHELGRHEAAAGAYRDGLKITEQLVAGFPAVPDYQNELAGTLVNLARLLRDRRDFAQARTLLERARPHHQAALQANAQNSTYRQFFANNLACLAPTLVRMGDHGAAAATAEELAGLSWARANDIYNAACALALCVPAAEKDTKLSEAERLKQARTYTDRAIALLRRAISKGYKNGAHMKQDPDLKPLLGRPDFQQLVQELEQ